MRGGLVLLARSRSCLAAQPRHAHVRRAYCRLQTTAVARPAQPPAAQQPPAGRHRRDRPSAAVTGASDEVVAAWRHALLASAPTHVVQVRGVSFGKQGTVSQLVPGQAVVVMHEPSNAVDPGALAMYDARLWQLGYVGRHMQQSFPLPVCFGQVVRVGRAKEGGLWGATVSVQPSVQGLWLHPMPDTWQAQVQLEQVVGRDTWQQLQQRVLERYGHRCAISSCPGEERPLQVVPQWGLDLLKKQVYLAALLPVCEPLLALQQQLVSAGEAMLDAGDVRVAEIDMWTAWCASANVAVFGASEVAARHRAESPWLPDMPEGSEADYREQLQSALDNMVAYAGANATDQQWQAVQDLRILMGWRPIDCLWYVFRAVELRTELVEKGWQLVLPDAQQLAAAGAGVGVGDAGDAGGAADAVASTGFPTAGGAVDAGAKSN